MNHVRLRWDKQLLIDFGLTSTSALPEDKAVDLYVLERAFASTHPDSERLFQRVLDAYARETGKAWTPIHRRLQEGKCHVG
jgi:TP53 regulating kinase-like protein